jgi:hypothetical protein
MPKRKLEKAVGSEAAAAAALFAKAPAPKKPKADSDDDDAASMSGPAAAAPPAAAAAAAAAAPAGDGTLSVHEALARVGAAEAGLYSALAALTDKKAELAAKKSGDKKGAGGRPTKTLKTYQEAVTVAEELLEEAQLARIKAEKAAASKAAAAAGAAGAGGSTAAPKAAAKTGKAGAAGGAGGAGEAKDTFVANATAEEMAAAAVRDKAVKKMTKTSARLVQSIGQSIADAPSEVLAVDEKTALTFKRLLLGDSKPTGTITGVLHQSHHV